jgi:hypothetical protein
MNELREVYDPTNYFLNKTRSVYVNLDGNMLRLQTTTSRIPKRTVVGEMIPQVTFNEQRIYDLTGCEVFILPRELVRKRYWSKKYPLCIKGARLQNGKSFNQSMSSNSISNLDNNKSMNRNTSSLNISGVQSDSPEIEDQLNMSQQLDQGTLILFGRCDREKEEWFKLFKKSSKQQLMDSKQYLKINRSSSSIKKRGSISTTTTNESTSIVCDTKNERLVYKIINSGDDMNKSETISQLNTKLSESTSQENLSINNNIKNMSTQTNQCLIYDTSLTVINTFLIRIFADFFNSKDYIKKIQTKIQNKLNTISVPYFIESLVITDLNLGNLIPLIRETSEPWHDERGLWVHLDIDYSGGVQMSLATKLNLMKLKSTSSNKETASSPSSTNLNTVFSFKNLANNNNGDTNSNDDEQCLSMFSSGLQLASDNTSINSDSSSINNDSTISNNQDKFKRKNVFTKNQKRHLGMTNSDEEDSAESSGDEYVHTGFNDEDNKLIET